MKKIAFLLPIMLLIKDCIAQKVPYRDWLVTKIEQVSIESGIQLKESCTNLIVSDLISLRENYEKNYLPDDEINILLDNYTFEVIGTMRMDSSWNSKDFGEDDYSHIRSGLFRQLVTLVFESEPDSAKIFIDGTSMALGNTQLKKPFESNKTMVFVFKRKGYEDLIKKWKVSPYPPTQDVKVKLKTKN